MMSCESAPALSVVTRTLNRTAFLQRAARSIMAQTCRDFEWVIVNDGGAVDPVDAIAADAALQGLKTIVVHRQANGGMAAAANAGIEASNAALVVLHDDDDTWQPDFVERTVSFLTANAQAAGVCTQANQVNESIENGEITEISRFVLNGDLQSLNIADNLVHNRVLTIAFVYRRELYEAVGQYDDRMLVMDDWDFVLRVIENHEIHVIPEPLANYHQRVDQHDRNDPASNTVISGRNIHSQTDSEIRDRMLRAELARGRVGIGFLATIARINIRNDELLKQSIGGVQLEVMRQSEKACNTTQSTAFDRYRQLQELKLILESRLDKIQSDLILRSDGLHRDLLNITQNLSTMSKQLDEQSFKLGEMHTQMMQGLTRCEDLLARLSEEREMGFLRRLKAFFIGPSRGDGNRGSENRST